jgi:hypothetical protein
MKEYFQVLFMIIGIINWRPLPIGIKVLEGRLEIVGEEDLI